MTSHKRYDEVFASNSYSKNIISMCPAQRNIFFKSKETLQEFNDWRVES